VNVNSRVPCGQGKAGLSIFIYVFPAKCAGYQDFGLITPDILKRH
jgi:hypothetical protein